MTHFDDIIRHGQYAKITHLTGSDEEEDSELAVTVYLSTIGLDVMQTFFTDDVGGNTLYANAHTKSVVQIFSSISFKHI